jgi:hypothetical protein
MTQYFVLASREKQIPFEIKDGQIRIRDTGYLSKDELQSATAEILKRDDLS